MDDGSSTMMTRLFRWTDRKAHLLLCASCEPVLIWVGCPELRAALEVGEEHSDGNATADQIWAASMRATAAVSRLTDEVKREIADVVCRAARFSVHFWRGDRLVRSGPRDVPNLMSAALGWAELVGGLVDSRTFLRSLFDDLAHRGILLVQEWRTDTVLTIAKQMYESRDFSAMPILADALQDAGCDSPEVLDHCRGPGPHVRGCWVVDLVLGKE